MLNLALLLGRAREADRTTIANPRIIVVREHGGARRRAGLRVAALGPVRELVNGFAALAAAPPTVAASVRLRERLDRRGSALRRARCHGAVRRARPRGARGQGRPVVSDAAVQRALAIAGRRAGIGQSASASAWARERARAVLERGVAPLRFNRRGCRAAHLDPAAVEELVVALRVGETRFYRDRIQWEALEQQVLPTLPEGKSPRSAQAAVPAKRPTPWPCSSRAPAAAHFASTASTARPRPSRALARASTIPARRAIYGVARSLLRRERGRGRRARALNRAEPARPGDVRAPRSRPPRAARPLPPRALQERDPLPGDARRRRRRAPPRLPTFSDDGVLLTASSEVSRLRAAGLAKGIASGVVGFGREKPRREGRS